MREELSAVDEFHEHIELRLVLEATEEVDDERMFDHRQDASLAHDVVHLFQSDDLAFLEHLESKRIVCQDLLCASFCRIEFDFSYSTECTRAQGLAHDEARMVLDLRHPQLGFDVLYHLVFRRHGFIVVRFFLSSRLPIPSCSVVAFAVVCFCLLEK